MSDPNWYYAKDEQQQGPVTPAQLKSLANSGKLLPTDLVWKEGMADWAPASDVKGLFAFVTLPPPPPEPSTPQPTGATTASSPAAEEQPPSSPSVPTPPEPKFEPSPGSTPTAASGSLPGAMPTFVPPHPPAPDPVITTHTQRTAARRESPRHGSPSSPWWLIIGRPLLFGGLLLVMSLRGCDSLANRYAARLVASSEVAELQFDDLWTARRAKLEAERETLNAKPERTIDDNVRIENLDTQLSMLNEQMRKERSEKQLAWNELRNAARDAAASTQMWAFWRQLLFLPAALVFVVGLILVGSAADGAERWLCLTMLAIVVYSLFVGGAAWTG
jgi:hypothetical protein